MNGPGSGAAPPQGFPLPREMVLASAGSGKTYHLSSRLIGLLALGVAPEALWASTFTRKAAAEILDQLLLRLARGALDPGRAEELADGAWLFPDTPRPPDFLDQEECGGLLAALVRSLHRANIGTLDAFFVQVATTFGEELGLPPSWKLVDGPLEDRMRSEALEAVLSREDSAVMAELVRIMAKGEVRRGVQSHLLDQVDALLQLQREVDPKVEDAWNPVFAGMDTADAPSKEEIEGRCGELADAMASAEPPLTQAGKPAAKWQTELLRLAEVVRERDWKAFFAKGLGKKLVETGRLIPAGEIEFYRHSPDQEFAGLLEEAVTLARADLGRDLIRQGQALGRMALRYQDAFERVQQAQGGFRFGDITHLLRESSVLGTADALYFRLDARIQHILLDEFQDTSLPQWDVLEPLVSELLAGGDTERAAVLVADPKQSIYAWRGAQPRLVEDVQGRYGLEAEHLPKSYRSGPDILNTVDGVFRELESNTVVQEMSGGPEVAREWVKAFYRQDPHDEDQPGYARLVVGPESQGTGALQPALLNYAAELIGELHRQDPRASIGVLVRTNKVVSYLIAALRQLKIPASGEGGTPLTDTAPVNALLALFKMADHPGDRLARYHVAQSPVGEVVEYTTHQAGAEANRLARRIRGRLMRDGYGATLDGWIRGLEPACDERERARLLQLVELGFLWDGQRTLRPGDFVRFVEGQRVEDPSGASIRVMTVHQSKGLQFDVVVLPQLNPSLEKGGAQDPVVPLRDRTSGRVVRVYPATDQGTRALFPELQKAHAQERGRRLRDELSILYVAMTRARYALHMVVPADGEKGPGSSKSPARILREALVPDNPADAVGKALYEQGNPRWFEELKVEDFSGAAPSDDGGPTSLQATGPVSLKPVVGPRTRNLARRSPSSLEGGDTVDLAALLRMDLTGETRLRGTIVHEWCEALEWMEEGIPDDDALRSLALASREGSGLPSGRVDEWLSDFRVWMEAPAIAAALSRAGYPTGARVERELPFLHRIPDGILQGYIDRLVIVEEGGRVVGAEVLDFKTDQLDGSDPGAVEAKVADYRPQIDAYRTAVAGRYRLELSAVSGKLLFLRPGLVREV